MARVQLLGGSYQARSVIANAQRCVNLYPEFNPQPDQAPVPVTHYQTPGLSLLATPPTGMGRGIYRSSKGTLFAVIGSNVYIIQANWAFTNIGSIVTSVGPVNMIDNGLDVILTDGTAAGWKWSVVDGSSFAAISDPNFFGGIINDYLDSYFLFVQPQTTNFYSSLSNSTTFDPLYLVARSGFPDPLQGVRVVNRQILLLGQLTSELWYNAGTPDFPFGEMPGMLVEHGCAAPYSIAKQDTSIYFLSSDLQGQGIVMKVSEYVAKRISNHALENAIAGYASINDAQAYTYQQLGHTFYVLSFPSADVTWVYDEATNCWHQWAWSDVNGDLHRHRVGFGAFAFGINVGLDWETGKLYSINPTAYYDNSDPIVRIRGFPHIVSDGRRLYHRRFIADVAVGANPFNVNTNLTLRWSNTRGSSWANPISSNLGATGDYIKSVQFQRLGMARDRVYELSWSAPVDTALNGAWLEYERAAA